MLAKASEDRFYFIDGTVSQFDDEYNQLHRDDGPAMILASRCRVYIGSDVEVDGPAQVWLVKNKIHREDGPAIEEQDHPPRYFIWNVELEEQVFYQLLETSDLDYLQNTLNSQNKAERYLAEKRLNELKMQTGKKVS